MSKLVRQQKTKVICARKDASYSEHSPYWSDAEAHGRASNHKDGLNEHPQANPDVLSETGTAAPSTPQLLMGEAIEHLQGRQKEVYFLLLRESKTYAEVAEVLGITRGAVQVYERRAIKFIKQYCRNAMVKGRV